MSKQYKSELSCPLPRFFDTQPYFKQEPDLWAWNPFITGSEKSFLQVWRDPVRLLLQLMSPKTQDYIKVGSEEGNSKWEAEEGKTENVRVSQWKKHTHTYQKKEKSQAGQQQLLYSRIIHTGLPEGPELFLELFIRSISH